MRIEYDQQADALYISLQKQAVSESDEVEPGVILDFDKKGGVIGIEILDASRKVPSPELVSFSVKNLAAISR